MHNRAYKITLPNGDSLEFPTDRQRIEELRTNIFSEFVDNNDNMVNALEALQECIFAALVHIKDYHSGITYNHLREIVKQLAIELDHYLVEAENHDLRTGMN